MFNADVTTNVANFLNDFDLTPRHHLSGNYLKNAGSLSRIIVAAVEKSPFAIVYLISDISLVNYTEAHRIFRNILLAECHGAFHDTPSSKMHHVVA